MKKSLPDVFVEGARKGWNIAVHSIMPNVVMAFAIIEVLKITGLLNILGNIFTPVMAIFGLPGAAIMVLLGAWMSMGGGVGVAASLLSSGTLNGTHAAILLPAIFLMGSQIQYMGRLLGTAEVQTKYYPMLFAICIINAVLAMLIMRLFV